MLMVGCETSRDQRIVPRLVADPVLRRRAPSWSTPRSASGSRSSRISCCCARERPHLVEEALDRRRMAVRLHQRVAAPARGARPDCRSAPRSSNARPARGPRPHFSPVETSSSSTIPLAPRLTWTPPSRSWLPSGMMMPTHLRSAASTSGLKTISRKFGEPISSSPSQTSTRFTGSFLPAALNACSAARNAICGPLVFVAPRPMHDLADARPVDDPRLERRRAPLLRIELLHVVHEVDRRAWCAPRRRASRRRRACPRSG